MTLGDVLPALPQGTLDGSIGSIVVLAADEISGRGHLNNRILFSMRPAGRIIRLAAAPHA